MDEFVRLAAESATGVIRRQNGVELAAFGVILFIFGILVPVGPNVCVLFSLILIPTSALMIWTGRRKEQRAEEALARMHRQRL